MEGGTTINLMRPFVPESLRCIDWSGQEVSTEVSQQEVVVFGKKKEVFVSYCPILEMCLTGIQSKLDEWSGKFQWRLDLEEV